MIVANIQKMQGYLLTEALISLLLISIGVLGLASLQGNMHAQNTEAQLRLEATAKANEILSMAIADPDNANCYVVPINQQVGCASNLALAYTTNWANEVNTQFPGAAAAAPRVTLDANNRLTAQIQWKKPTDPMTHRYVLVGQIGL